LLSHTSNTMAGKKKWSKGKTKEKSDHKVIFDPETHDRLLKEAAKYKLITTSVLVERLKINGSLARSAIRELIAKDLVKPVSTHQAQLVYTRATHGAAE
jgi:small subunit ribosomal protein S25e